MSVRSAPRGGGGGPSPEGRLRQRVPQARGHLRSRRRRRHRLQPHIRFPNARASVQSIKSVAGDLQCSYPPSGPCGVTSSCLAARRDCSGLWGHAHNALGISTLKLAELVRQAFTQIRLVHNKKSFKASIGEHAAVARSHYARHRRTRGEPRTRRERGSTSRVQSKFFISYGCGSAALGDDRAAGCGARLCTRHRPRSLSRPQRHYDSDVHGDRDPGAPERSPAPQLDCTGRVSCICTPEAWF